MQKGVLHYDSWMFQFEFMDKSNGTFITVGTSQFDFMDKSNGTFMTVGHPNLSLWIKVRVFPPYSVI